MTFGTTAAGWSGALLVALAAALLSGHVVSRARQAHPVLTTYLAGIDRDLAFLRWPVRARQVLVGQAVILAALVASTTVLGATTLVMTVPVVVAPQFAVARARLLRTRALEAQLEGWLVAIANTLASTASLGEAVASSVTLLRSPLRDEVDTVVSQVRLGTPLDRALERFSSRARSRVVSGALLSLRIARNSGGDLRATLQTAAATLREMARLEGVVRAKTAEGKAQALAVSIVPAPLVAAVNAMAPEFFAPLSRSPAGALVVLGAILLWAGAIALAAKITAVDV